MYIINSCIYIYIILKDTHIYLYSNLFSLSYLIMMLYLYHLYGYGLITYRYDLPGDEHSFTCNFDVHLVPAFWPVPISWYNQDMTIKNSQAILHSLSRAIKWIWCHGGSSRSNECLRCLKVLRWWEMYSINFFKETCIYIYIYMYINKHMHMYVCIYIYIFNMCIYSFFQTHDELHRCYT